MGESHGDWPVKGSASGILDLAGFEKPSYHMYKTLWNDEPHVYLTTQNIENSLYDVDKSTGLVVERRPGAWKHRLWSWHDVNEHWNYTPSEMIAVEVYSNCEEVELFLNGESLGSKRLSDFEDRIYKWAVPFAEGTLVAKGKQGDRFVNTQLFTASDPAAISLSVDKSKLKADGYDVAHLVAQLVDQKGHPVKTDERKISFKVEGDCRVLGVDNGAPDNVQDFQSNKIITDKGRCLLLVQSTRKASNLKITAKSENLDSESLKISIQ